MDIDTIQRRLWDASACGNVNAIRQSIMQGADLEARDENDRTALHIASQNGHTEAMRTIIAARRMRFMIDIGGADAAGDMPEAEEMKQKARA